MITGLIPENIGRILLCQQGGIGEVVLSTPTIALVANAFPWAKIDFLTEKKCVPILQHNPNIHRIIEVDMNHVYSIFTQIPYAIRMSNYSYDMIIALQNTSFIHWICFFSGAKYKLSNTPKWYNRIFFTQVVKQHGSYIAQKKASVLKLLDIEWNNETPTIYLTEEEKEHARNVLFSLGVKKGTILFTLDITSKIRTRKYSIDGYASIVNAVVERFPKIRFLPLYGPGEEEDILQLVSKVKHRASLVLPPHMLSLREMASIMFYASLHIGNASAPRYIATAVLTPTFTILGSTGEGWDYPSNAHISFSVNLPCQPCWKSVCPRVKDQNACLDSVPTTWILESLFAQINTILKASK